MSEVEFTLTIKGTLQEIADAHNAIMNRLDKMNANAELTTVKPISYRLTRLIKAGALKKRAPTGPLYTIGKTGTKRVIVAPKPNAPGWEVGKIIA